VKIIQTHEMETVNLSGLPLVGFNIDAKYGDYSIDFSAPNPTGCGDANISLGSGDLYASGLLNSRFDLVKVRTVSGRIRLAFDGVSLERDMTVRLETESGGVWLEIPEHIPAQIVYRTYSGTVIKAESPFNPIDSTTYEIGGYHVSDSPRLTIEVDTVMGDLRLTST